MAAIPNFDPYEEERLRRVERQRERASSQVVQTGGRVARFECPVVGTTFALGDNYRKWVAGLQAGAELELRRNPANQHDANAIEVWATPVRVRIPYDPEKPGPSGAWTVTEPMMLGHLPAAVARTHAPRIDAGSVYRAEVAYVGDHPGTPQIGVVVHPGDDVETGPAFGSFLQVVGSRGLSRCPKCRALPKVEHLEAKECGFCGCPLDVEEVIYEEVQR